MERNDRILLVALAILTTSSLLVWAIVAGAFAAPGHAGWLYNYQTLIGVGAALIGAYFTVAMMRREQRQQRDHFEQQMEIITRPDRLRVSRETARLIPILRGGLAEVRANATLAVAPYRGTETRSERLTRIAMNYPARSMKESSLSFCLSWATISPSSEGASGCDSGKLRKGYLRPSWHAIFLGPRKSKFCSRMT